MSCIEELLYEEWLSALDVSCKCVMCNVYGSSDDISCTQQDNNKLFVIDELHNIKCSKCGDDATIYFGGGG
jgi:hypothetical protein